MVQIRDDERGQGLPVIVLFLLVLIGVIALVLDGGIAYTQRRFMQNAADAGVLAAAVRLAEGEYSDAVVRQTAIQYAQHNGAASATLTYLDANKNPLPDPPDGFVPADAASIRVTAWRTYPGFLAQVLGVNTFTVSAQATARAVPAAMPQQMRGLAPLSVPINFFEACASRGVSCDLWDSSYARAWGIPANEYKSLVDLSNGTYEGSLPQNVSDWTYGGFPSDISRGGWFPSISGNYGNNVANALRQRIIEDPLGADPDGVIYGYIDIVIWDQFEPADKTTGTPMRVNVAKFGRFKVRLDDVYGSHTYGYFIDFVVPGHERGPGGEPAGPKLIVLGG